MRNLKFAYIILFVGLFIFGGFFAGSRETSKINVVLKPPSTAKQIANNSLAEVLRVVDGDTIEVSLRGKKETIRLIGIDSPEVLDERKPTQCFGKEASNKAKEVLTGKIITLEPDATQGDRDEYGRLLRYVFLDNLNFNELMLDEGYAREYTFKSRNYKYRTEFIQAEKKARGESKGLWGSC